MAMKTILKKLLNVKYMKVNRVNFDGENSTLYIHVESTKGKKKLCPICGKKCRGYDSTTKSRTWRHLDFGSCKVILVADVHRIECKEHGVHTPWVPWAYHNSRFTKEFEQQTAYLALHLNKTEVAKIMRISWNTVGPIVTRMKNLFEPDSSVRFANLTKIGIDETSHRKGHKYLTVVLDHDTNQVVWVGPGTGKNVLEKFMKLLTKEQRENIELVSADGAKWIKKCVDDWLPNADFCIDGFHVVSWGIEAMDECRKIIWREESKKYKEAKAEQEPREKGRPKKGEEVVSKEKVKNMKSAKYALGKNPGNLTKNQESCLEEIRSVYPKLFRAYQIKEGLRAVFRSTPERVEEELKRWLSWACRCRIEVFVKLSKKIRRHYNSIINTVNYNLSNARLESMNNKIKVIIRKAYGFRNMQNLIDTVMIVCSRLYYEIKLPHQTR